MKRESGSPAGNVRRLDDERRRAHRPAHLLLAPPLARSSMTPHPWGPINPLVRWMQALLRRGSRPPYQTWSDASRDGPAGDDWQHDGNVRRLVLLMLVLVQTAAATYFMCKVLPYQGTTPPEMALVALFAVLFCWVSSGFWTAMTGFLVLLRGDDRHGISATVNADAPIPPGVRTALVMPVCNEDVARVLAGLRATYESLARCAEPRGEMERFDFFILSDSSNSDIRTAELAGWAALCRAVDGFGRIFYRHRRRRVKRKSGNIDDFCRRWGKNYRYMIVLDADSVMSGDCIMRLVRMMEANSRAGIIQTAPRAFGRETLYARIQQFATRVVGPLFTAGLHYWQLGESHYWGHNAIIRLAPFMRHCALSPLPGRGSLSGEILSHDFVEAALMRRAGWSVWIAWDLDGSYEELPPNLLDELKRDRRWCHGNLMNLRLCCARGIHPVHRAVFVTGALAYLSAPLWFLFLVLSTALLAMHSLTEPQYFVEPQQLFPLWPQWHPEKALALFGATATLLFLPKLLAALLLCARGAHRFGGRMRVLLGMLLEILFSMLLAPVRMLFHTHFILVALLGLGIHWKSPPRGDAQTGWGEAIRRHGMHTVLGIGWGAGVYWINPSFLPWLLPIAGALALSVPVSVWSSRVSLGRLFRRMKLFAIPEELDTPAELRATVAYTETAPALPGFVDTVADPGINALVRATGRPRKRLPEYRAAQRAGLARLALLAGPEELEEATRNRLLDDPELLGQLHREVIEREHGHWKWMAR